jgi:hypothetical protein
MGNGALNPKTASGMLPATSDNTPYVLTSIGLLDAASGQVWRAFDQVPAIGEASVVSEYNEFLDSNNAVSSKRGVMVDLCIGNEKCFDKFTFAHSAYMSGYFLPARLLIQGSNHVGVTVNDDIDSGNWESLFKSYIQTYWNPTPEIGTMVPVDPVPDWAYGQWDRNYYCWDNSVKYRYYRVMFGALDGVWDQYNECALSEMRFIEEQVASSITKLILHCNGENNSRVFVDSSNEAHTVITHGDAKQTTDNFQLGTASAIFGSGEDYISIEDDDNWAIFNTPFTIQTFFKRNNVSGEQIIFQQYEDYANYARCSFNGSSEVLDLTVMKDGHEKIHLSCIAPFVSGEFNHIAIVGNWE